MSIQVDIEKNIGSFRLEVAFSAENEILSLLGASGCGKSMTLHCIAGIVTPDKGKIVVDGVTLFDSKKRINLPPQKRKVGLLFQNYALFPNMTVFGNLRAGCRMPKPEQTAKIQELLKTFELTELQNHYPHQLSGGQQQRTALARILLSEPNILLLDEPFSALDGHLRFRLEQEMMDVLQKFGKTVLLVSHDRDEVFRMSDKIAVMHQGYLAVQGSRDEVFKNPRTRQAAILTGCKNVAACTYIRENTVYVQEWGMELEVSDAPNAAFVGIRMHGILPGEGENTVRCQMVSEIENPFSFVVMLRPESAPDASPFAWEMDKEMWAKLRSNNITVHIPKANISCLQDDNRIL